MYKPKISHRLNMGLKTRLSSYCTKRGNNTMNLVTSRKTNTRLARPIDLYLYKEATLLGHINDAKGVAS